MDGAGTLQGRWSLAGGKAAGRGCTICRKPVLPGAKLCGACRAALKRARQATVSQELTPPRVSSRKRARTIAPPAAAAARTPSPSAIGRKRVAIAAVTAVVVGALAALYFARPGKPALAPPAPSAPAPVAAKPATPTEPAAPREEARLVPAPVAATPRAPVPHAARRSPEPPAPAEPIWLAIDVEPPPAPPPPAPVVAAPPPPAPAPTRWQLLAEATSACAGEPFLARVVCVERARLQYCDGYWGQVEQCPSGISNDHGR